MVANKSLTGSVGFVYYIPTETTTKEIKIMKNSQIIAAASHINIFEIVTTNGDVVGVLSTKEKIKTFPHFESVATVNDANYSQSWLTAEDTKLFLAAETAFNQ